MALPTSFDEKWFERGKLSVVSGAASGLARNIKSDLITTSGRRIELWESLVLPVAVGDVVNIIAGCDKGQETCRSKFDNYLNFRGFPHIPGEDWLAAYPRYDAAHTGGSMNN